MTTLQHTLALSSASTVVMVILIILAGTVRKWIPGKLQSYIPLLAPLIVLLPVDGLPVYTYIRGAIGDLSIVSQGLIITIVIQRLLQKQIVDDASMQRLTLFVSIMGILLYPAALGLGPVDTYSMGYQGILLPLLVLLGAIWLLYSRAMLASGLFALAAPMAAIGAMESSNLWDYIVDPLLFFYMAYQLLTQLWCRRKATLL
jgi:hypothetical protein